MGAWSVDVLGGDTPLDMLALFEEILGERSDDGGLYPLILHEDDRQRLRPKLEDADIQTQMLSVISSISEITGDERDVAGTVMGALYLVTGAAWADATRDTAVKAAEALAANARQHGWNDPKQRRDYMTNLAEAFKQHEPGKLFDIQHVGLFAKLRQHTEAGKTGLINEK